MIHLFLLLVQLIEVISKVRSIEVPKLAPLEDQYFKDNPIKKKFYDHSFAGVKLLKAKDPICQDQASVKFVPVYYWPGRTVELPCITCDVDTHLNGGPQVWLAYGREDLWTDGWEARQFVKLKTLLQSEFMQTVQELYGKYTEYYQRDGKLIIVGAHLHSDGLYTCVSEKTMGDPQIEIVYVLGAYLPPVWATVLFTRPLFNDPYTHGRGISTYETGSQAPLRTSYFKVRDNGIHPTHKKNKGTDLEPITAVKEGFKVPKTKPFYYRGEFSAIEETFEWGPWSRCRACLPNKGYRLREGHKLLRPRGDGTNLKKLATGSYQKDQLYRMLSKSLLTKTGVRAWSSPVLWGLVKKCPGLSKNKFVKNFKDQPDYVDGCAAAVTHGLSTMDFLGEHMDPNGLEEDGIVLQEDVDYVKWEAPSAAEASLVTGCVADEMANLYDYVNARQAEYKIDAVYFSRRGLAATFVQYEQCSGKCHRSHDEL